MSSIVSSAMAKMTGRKRKGSSPSSSPEGRSIPPEPVQSNPLGDFAEHDAEPAMQVHNLARASKRCDKLDWNSRLAKDAQAHADALAEREEMKHSGVQDQGENLYMSTGHVEHDEAVEDWLNEERRYNNEKIGEGDLSEWGHFTQCLWHSTKEVGMGRATSRNGATYIVARYSPPGNMSGQKPF